MDQLTESPPNARQDWLTRNHVILQTVEDGFGDGTIYIASIQGRLRFATGSTEREAIVKLCGFHAMDLTNFLK